jgi:arylsulfatase A-like enzyme
VKNGGTLRTDPGHFIDVLPTFVDLAGGDVRSLQPVGPPLPGVSLIGAIRDGQKTQRDFLYFNHSNNRAFAVGRLEDRGKEPGWIVGAL